MGGGNTIRHYAMSEKERANEKNESIGHDGDGNSGSLSFVAVPCSTCSRDDHHRLNHMTASGPVFPRP